MAQLTQLDQVKLEAERITLKRIQEAKEQKAWQESKDGAVVLGEAEEAIAEAKVGAETVVKKKGKK